LRGHVRQTAQKQKRRTLCLLVVYNAPLISAWEKTLNNREINKFQQYYHRKLREDASVKKMIEVLKTEKCWQEGTGLSV